MQSVTHDENDPWNHIRELDDIYSGRNEYEYLSTKDLTTICEIRKMEFYGMMSKLELCKLLRRNDDDPSIKFDETVRERALKALEGFVMAGGRVNFINLKNL